MAEPCAFRQVIPRCPRCGSEDGAPGILKPDIVFFGESLPEHFHRQMTTDKDEADLLIVIGSTLKVRPVALIPSKFIWTTFCDSRLSDVRRSKRCLK